jgi:hypothetical protein
MTRRVIPLVLLGTLLTLNPVARASPPDQTWIAGVYDNADYDDVVRAVSAAVASLGLRPPLDSRAFDAVRAFTPQIDEARCATRAPWSYHTRPPPAP